MSAGKEVTGMATKPTNEHLAEMLVQILRELEEIRQAQTQLASDVRALIP